MWMGGNGVVFMDVVFVVGLCGQLVGVVGKYEFELVQIGWGGDFEVVFVVFYQQWVLVLVFYGYGFVGDFDFGGSGVGQCVVKLVVVEQLWCQCMLQLFVWFSVIDVIVVVCVFEGVVYWCGQDCFDWIGMFDFKQVIKIGQ